MIGDSPPHGHAGAYNDGFPDGCPCGLTAGGLTELLAHRKITLHAISIAGILETTEAFKLVAEPTGGDVQVVENARASMESYGATVSATSASVAAGRSYGRSMSARAVGSSYSMIAKETGMTIEEVKSTEDYLKMRGIKTPKHVDDEEKKKA